MSDAKTEAFVKKVPWWVKAFVAWHVYAMTAWSLPQPPPALMNGQISFSFGELISRPVPWALALNQRIKGTSWLPLRPYMMATGLWQYWDMFAPNPSNLDIWLDAEVTFANGDKSTQLYPRMAAMSYPERYVKERFRKYVERVNPPEFDYKKPALGQWLAYEAAKDPGNPPVSIVVRRHFRKIRPYPQPTPQEDTTEVIWSGPVDQEKLKRDKGW